MSADGISDPVQQALRVHSPALMKTGTRQAQATQPRKLKAAQNRTDRWLHRTVPAARHGHQVCRQPQCCQGFRPYPWPGLDQTGEPDD
jgi:hypothetical protein